MAAPPRNPRRLSALFKDVLPGKQPSVQVDASEPVSVSPPPPSNGYRYSRLTKSPPRAAAVPVARVTSPPLLPQPICDVPPLPTTTRLVYGEDAAVRAGPAAESVLSDDAAVEEPAPVTREPLDESQNVPLSPLAPATSAETSPREMPPVVRAKAKRWRLPRRLTAPFSKERDVEAWIAGRSQKVVYELGPLMNGEPVPELWHDDGDTLVHLYPESSGKGPSFKLHSSLLASSALLTQLGHGVLYGVDSVTPLEGDQPVFRGFDSEIPIEDFTPVVNGFADSLNSSLDSLPLAPNADDQNPAGVERIGSNTAAEGAPEQLPLTHLNFPVDLGVAGSSSSPSSPGSGTLRDDTNTLIGVRNLFAFLTGQSLVATETCPNLFSIFLNISEHLQAQEFTNADGSTFGAVAAASFDEYVSELHLGDVRASREKTIEGLVLGERMRSVLLYNEAFVHAAGKYGDVRYVSDLEDVRAKWNLLSTVTRERLERAAIELQSRRQAVERRLESFEFPSLWAGVMSSRTAEGKKGIDASAWKNGFHGMRRHIVKYYRDKYGSWPPRANPKKNDLQTDGLNRLVLKEVYRDFCDLYDLLVDRTLLTTRAMSADAPAPDETGEGVGPVAHMLRRVLDEHDRSSPPIQPPIPFDVPILPFLLDAADEPPNNKARPKRLKEDELLRMLHAARNSDADTARRKTPFLDAFAYFEQRSARGCRIAELVGQRAGHWLLVYAVVNALPLLASDAPGVRWRQGVEYFLCSPPRSGVPWARQDPATLTKWYSVSGGQGVVCLPADVVDHGVEGVYKRSHCWARAAQWRRGRDGVGAEVDGDGLLLSPPRPMTEALQDGALSRPSSQHASPSARQASGSVVSPGLEAMPAQAGLAPRGSADARRASYAGSATFDDILGQ